MSRFFALAVALLLVGCGSNPAAVPATPPPAAGRSLPDVGLAPKPEPRTLPPVPLKLTKPQMPPADFEGHDLARVAGRALEGSASDAANSNDYKTAAQLQAWAVKNSGTGYYNLACYTARNQDIEPAFYYLQEAAVKDGVNAPWAERDADLQPLRKDPRWSVVREFLARCNAYWAGSGLVKTVVVLPEGYRVGTPIGVVVGMHGMGSNPDDLVTEEVFQGYADTLRMAIVAVSGTVPTGPKGFTWSDDPQRDDAHLRRTLVSLQDKLTVDSAHVVLYGFSQGGLMAFETAWLRPDDYRGALVMSPGTTPGSYTPGTTKVPANARQGYVFACGALESPGNIQFTEAAAQRAKAVGARVELLLAKGQAQHAFPSDFREKFVDWIRLIDGKAKSE